MAARIHSKEDIQDALARTGDNVTKAAELLGVTPNSLYKRIKRMRCQGRTERRSIDRYIITSAQNNSPIHKPFFDTLMQCRAHYNAELIVIPVKYENITLTSKHGKEDLWWHSKVVPFLCRRRRALNRHLTVMGDISTNATNKNPLAGFETITGKKSGIFGHGQLEMKVIPTPATKLPKKLQTTGSVTVPNYTDTTRGKIAEDNHCIGALMVEVKGDKFWIRQLRAEPGGGFYDLDLRFNRFGVGVSYQGIGLVCGDIHWDHICPQVLAATFTNPNSIVNILNPAAIALHDVFDGYAGSHHHKKDPVLQYYKRTHGRDSVEDELQRLIEGLKIMAMRPLFIVDSNHNRHFTRWLNDFDPKTDLENLELWHRVRLAQIQDARDVDDPRDRINPLEWYIRQYEPGLDIRFIGHDSGHSFGRYDITNHGDIGANGVRGSAQQFTKFGGYYILGHSHTPGVYKNVIQVGTSTRLDLEYVSGPSSWLNSHAFVYPNGMATHIDIIDGEWRA